MGQGGPWEVTLGKEAGPRSWRTLNGTGLDNCSRGLGEPLEEKRRKVTI